MRGDYICLIFEKKGVSFLAGYVDVQLITALGTCETCLKSDYCANGVSF